MKDKLLYIFWAGLYVICAILGFINQVSGAGILLLMLVALAFFVPAFWLLWEGLQTGNRSRVRFIRIVSICSLSITLVLLLANILSVTASETTGRVMHILLAIFSVPMFCSQHWLISLFLWACLMILSFKNIKK